MNTAAKLVTVTPYGRLGGSSRVRVFDWLDHLELFVDEHKYTDGRNNSASFLARHAISAVLAEWRLRSAVSTNIPLLMSREASPFSRGSLESRLLRESVHGVYDIDDALFYDHGHGYRRIFSKSVKCRRAASAADHVIAGNEMLADWASQYSARVTLIPSCVEPRNYRVKTSWDLRRRPRIVWLGSPATEQFLHLIADPLLEANRQLGARLTVISSGERSLGQLDRITDRVRWTIVGVADELSGADISIGPLIDTPYTRGKCAYKLLQYAASALPMAASPVGANSLALERFDGIAARTPDQWTEALLTLLTENANRRQNRGLRALSAVKEHYSFDRWAPTWKRAVGI